MLIFDEKIMTRARFSCSFILSDDEYGVTKDADEYGGVSESFYEVSENQECWVLNGFSSESVAGGDMIFVYIPEIDFATTVLSTHIKNW